MKAPANLVSLEKSMKGLGNASRVSSRITPLEGGTIVVFVSTLSVLQLNIGRLLAILCFEFLRNTHSIIFGSTKSQIFFCSSTIFGYSFINKSSVGSLSSQSRKRTLLLSKSFNKLIMISPVGLGNCDIWTIGFFAKLKHYESLNKAFFPPSYPYWSLLFATHKPELCVLKC